MENYTKKFLIKMPQYLGDYDDPSIRNMKAAKWIAEATYAFCDDMDYKVKLYPNEKSAAILESEGDTFGFEVLAEITGNDFYSDKAITERGGKILTLEVERRWLVKIPDNIGDFPYHTIEQAYLAAKGSAPESGLQGRIRRWDDKFIYTEKARTGSSAVRIENEREITENEYNEYKKHTILNTVKKKRYIIPYGGLEFEFDIFENTVESGYAIMEAELPDESVKVTLPDFIEVVAEVTEDSYYTNRNFASMDKIRLIKQGV